MPSSPLRRRAALVLVLATQVGCGAAGRGLGRGAVHGALETVREEEEAGERPLAQKIPGSAMLGALEQLSQPTQLEQLARVVATASAAALRGATQADPAPPEPAGLRPASSEVVTAEAPETPAEALARQAARAFATELARQLGADGHGPLGQSLSDTAGRVSASAVRGAQAEVVPLLPVGEVDGARGLRGAAACTGPDQAACVERSLHEIGRATSAGVVAGVRESIGAWIFALTFVAGALAAIAVAWAYSLHRAHRAR
jgi:hypothetical protein